MRRPNSGKASVAVKPLVSPGILTVVSIILVLVGLQQPWSASVVGAQSWLTISATVLSVLSAMLTWAVDYCRFGSGADQGLNPFARSVAFLRPGVTSRLWLAQVPLMAAAFGVLGGELIFGLGVGTGAGLALGGAVLAAQIGRGAMPKSIKPLYLGLAVFGLAVAAPIYLAVSNGLENWQPFAVATVCAIVCGYLTWSLLIPALQLESPLAARVVAPGNWFPKASLEQTVARAAMLGLLGFFLAAGASFQGAGATRHFEVARLGDAGLLLLLMPALGAACFPIVEANWQKCAPVMLRRAFGQVGLTTGTAILGFFALQAGLQLAVTQLGGELFCLGAAGELAVALVILGVAWSDHFGFIRFGLFWGKAVNWLQSSLIVADGAAAPSWEIADIPVMAHERRESWSGAHKWVGPTVHRSASGYDDAGGYDDARGSDNAIGHDGANGQPQNQTEIIAALGTNSISANYLSANPLETDAEAPQFHGDVTTHLPLANSQADFGLVGESNPAVTDSGRLVIPLARPKWTPQQALDPATHTGLLARIANEAPHLRPQVARNPSASPELLNWLAELNDPDVNVALASLSS